jgi:ribosomal protein S18 acetylase RimI-like enzyme
MIIRQATPDDAAALLPLIAAYWQCEGLPGFQAAAVGPPLALLLSSPGLGTVLLAAEEQSLVGYLTLVYVFSLEHRGMTAEIDELFVVPNHRASGLGSQLLLAAERASARLRCTNISLRVARANPRALGFYLRHGYSRRSEFELLEKPLGAV